MSAVARLSWLHPHGAELSREPSWDATTLPASWLINTVQLASLGAASAWEPLAEGRAAVGSWLQRLCMQRAARHTERGWRLWAQGAPWSLSRLLAAGASHGVGITRLYTHSPLLLSLQRLANAAEKFQKAHHWQDNIRVRLQLTMCCGDTRCDTPVPSLLPILQLLLPYPWFPMNFKATVIPIHRLREQIHSELVCSRVGVGRRGRLNRMRVWILAERFLRVSGLVFQGKRWARVAAHVPEAPDSSAWLLPGKERISAGRGKMLF